MKESIHKEYSTIRKITNLYLYPIIKYIRLERSLLCHNNKSLLKSKRTKFTLYTLTNHTYLYIRYIKFYLSFRITRIDMTLSSAYQPVRACLGKFSRLEKETGRRFLLAFFSLERRQNRVSRGVKSKQAAEREARFLPALQVNGLHFPAVVVTNGRGSINGRVLATRAIVSCLWRAK